MTAQKTVRKRLSLETRRRMSLAHQASSATAARIERQRGRPLSKQHRAAIADGMRRYFAKVVRRG